MNALSKKLHLLIWLAKREARGFADLDSSEDEINQKWQANHVRLRDTVEFILQMNQKETVTNEQVNEIVMDININAILARTCS